MIGARSYDDELRRPWGTSFGPLIVDPGCRRVNVGVNPVARVVNASGDLVQIEAQVIPPGAWWFPRPGEADRGELVISSLAGCRLEVWR